MESRLLLLTCLTLFLFVTATCAQEQYKKLARDSVAEIVDGKYDAAIRDSEKYLDKYPKDLESMYVMAVAYAQKGNIDKALGYVKQAVDTGLPFGRFLAGPRDLLKPLTESAGFKELAAKHGTELLHGPMLGCVTDKSARFWVRTLNEVSVQVIVSASEKMYPALMSDVAKASKAKDFTAIVGVQDLKPDTRYYYKMLVDGETVPRVWSFVTFPASGTKSKFRVGFGGGAGFTPQHERM